MKYLAFILFFPALVFGAEFEKKRPVKILELNEKTLLQNVWPGMTIKQAIQILGDPEEALTVEYSDGAPAVRYGIYWLIPQYDGIQIECIINQRGLKTTGENVKRCGSINKSYKLASQ